MPKKMTREQAVTKAIEWHELLDEAQCEEEAECHGAADAMRLAAADIETEIRKAGLDAGDLYKECRRAKR